MKRIVLFLFLVAGLASSAFAAARPNVIVILSDDQGWGDLSIHGNSNLSTPNIDSMARDGALFERFFVCAVCSPTRAEFLTGRYHPRGGVYSTSTGGERLNLDAKTIGDTFKAAGYATAAFGKWHNGSQHPYHPNSRGFDEYYGFTSGHWGEYFSPMLEHNGKIVKGNGFIIDDLTDHAIDFIQRNEDKSFFCYIPYNTPHTPFHVPDRFYDRFKNDPVKMRHQDTAREDIGDTRAALALCENIDWNVGRLFKALDDAKLSKDTLVLYFADNGPNSWRWNGGMKGRKGSTDEGGVRSPLLVRWPGHIQGGTRIPQIAGAIDLLPTLADIAGIPLAGNLPIDGKSLKPLLLGTAKDWPDRMIFSHWGNKVSVRTQRFRLDNAGSLFELEKDPGQDKDLAKAFPDETAKLSKAVAQWKKELLPGLRDDDRPFPIGGGGMRFPITHLPARDGVAHGNVKRSARAPNCSFFTGWTSPSDSITWDTEVMTAGRYEVVIHYTCPKADVGSTIELSLNGTTLKSKVTEAFESPLRGMEHDRMHRGSESYVKDWNTMKPGTMDLKAGRGPLTMRALDVPGKQVMDVRLIVMTLVK